MCSVIEAQVPVENENITLKCHVTYASKDGSTMKPSVYYVDERGTQMSGNTSENGKRIILKTY